jgi:MFS family permease
MLKRPPFSYGWVIVVISVFTTTLVYGMRHSFSIFFPYILAEFGWARGSTSVMLSLSILIYGVMSPLAGSLGDRWRPRLVVVFGITILALATASCAFAQRLWHFYLLFGVLMPIGMAFSGWPLMGPALTNWFTMRRGLILGLGQIGLGFSFVYVLLMEFTISRVGWRYAYFILAAILIGLLLPLAVFLFHYRPEDKGVMAHGSVVMPSERSLTPTASAFTNPDYREWTLRDAMKMYQLWCLVASFFFFWGIGHYLVLAHQIKFAVDAGFTTMLAASVFALLGIFSIFGYISGSISDWIGREIPIMLSATLSIVAVIALIFVKNASQTWLLYVYATCFGYAAGLFSSTVFAGAADLFHGRNYGAISNLLLTGLGLGGAIGPWLGGYIYDITGSYTRAFVLCMLSYALSCTAFWIAAPRNAAKFSIKK